MNDNGWVITRPSTIKRKTIPALPRHISRKKRDDIANQIRLNKSQSTVGGAIVVAREEWQCMKSHMTLMHRMITRYHRSDDPVQWDDKTALAMMEGSAIKDDPPAGWGNSRLAQFSRGRNYAEQIVAFNLLQFTFVILAWMDNPTLTFRKAFSLGNREENKWRKSTDERNSKEQ